MIDAALSVPTLVSAVFWAIAVGFLAVCVAAAIVQPWLCERRATRKDQPPVSIVLPVKLLEPGFARAQLSALEQNYPRFEVLASSVDADSPAVREIRAIFTRFPHRPSRVLHSSARFAVSPKVDNLHAPFTLAEHDVIFMKDANTVLESDDMAEALRQLTCDVGLVCAIPYAARPENLAARIEASIMNGAHARVLFLAGALGQGPGNGKIMLFRRADFMRAGGFASIAHTVGEDNAMAKAIRRIGLRSLFSHRPVRQELGKRDFWDVYHRQLRWAVIRRDDETPVFVLEPLSLAIPTVLAAAVAAPLAGLAPLTGAFATFCLWLSLETLLSFVKGWRLSWAAPAIFVLREAVLLAVWLHAWTTSRVVWAKDTLDARAAAAPPLSARAAKEEG